MVASVEHVAADAWWTRLVHEKGNLTRTQLLWVALAAAAPLLLVMTRLLALPGVLPPGLLTAPVIALGNALSQLLSLQWVPPADRNQVLYLLFFPTCVLLISLARLTFGIRVLGFRSILIAIGFQHSGPLSSLVLIGLVGVTILPLHPLLKRIRLPYYARVSVILCAVVLIMLSALLIAPTLRSPLLWNVAFFPVIVLGLLAEGIATTLDRSSGPVALWRAGMTIGIALLIALICQIPALRELVIEFPELLVSQILAIVLISELFDLRLLQDWDARLAGEAPAHLFSEGGVYRIAIVHDRAGEKTTRRSAARQARRIARELRDVGHGVEVVEADTRLLSALRDFLPERPRTRAPGGIVLDLTHGAQAHVPAVLELAGVAHTGPDAVAHALATDAVSLRARLRHAGLRMQPATGVPESGRTIDVALLGNGPIECLPLVEVSDAGEDCPAPLDDVIAARIRAVARAAFEACECRDCALVRVRITTSGKILVEAVDSTSCLDEDGTFELAARRAGLTLGALALRIVDAARERHRAGPKRATGT